MTPDCEMCEGTYCAAHHRASCECDTAERHGDEPCPRLAEEFWRAGGSGGDSFTMTVVNHWTFTPGEPRVTLHGRNE